MRFGPGDVFKDTHDSSCPAFAIIGVDEESEHYRVAEKWVRSSKENIWLSHWMPAEELHRWVEGDKASHKKKATDDELSGFRELVSQ